MSVHATAWAWQVREPLTPHELLVLVALADYAQDDGRAWPAMATLARRCRLHRSTVFRILERLERCHGLITPVRRKGGRDVASGRGRTNVYQLNLSGARYPVELTDMQQISTDPELGGSVPSDEVLHGATLELSTWVAPCDPSPPRHVASRDKLSRLARQVHVAPDATQPVMEPSITITHASASNLTVGDHGELVEVITLPDGRQFEIPPQPNPEASKLSEQEQNRAIHNVRKIKAQLATRGQGSERSEVLA